MRINHSVFSVLVAIFVGRSQNPHHVPFTLHLVSFCQCILGAGFALPVVGFVLGGFGFWLGFFGGEGGQGHDNTPANLCLTFLPKRTKF